MSLIDIRWTTKGVNNIPSVDIDMSLLNQPINRVEVVEGVPFEVWQSHVFIDIGGPALTTFFMRGERKREFK